MTPPRGRRRARRSDDGFALVSMVIVAAIVLAVVMVTLTAASADQQSSVRGRELAEARAAGAGALEYLYAWLRQNPDFFDEMGANPPTTYRWIDDASAAPPDPGVDAHWSAFTDSLQVTACSGGADPCWELRFDGDDATPEAVVAEAIVRFACRGDQCSTRRFQQRLMRLERLTRRVGTLGAQTEWARSGLAEVAATASISPPAPIP